MTNTDRTVIAFVKDKLIKAGFDISKWDLKEIPVENEVYTFQNYDDTVEFSAFISDGVLSLGYNDLDDDGYLIDVEADTIQEAIENTKMEREDFHPGHDKNKTVFEEH